MIIEDIKGKRYKVLDSFVKYLLEYYLKRNPKAEKYLDKPRSKEYKKIARDIRRMLHKITGAYFSKKEGLRAHASTRERLEFYKHIYKKIFNITGKPENILDLGCGLNPLSYEMMGVKAKYYAYDLDERNVEIVKEFFEKNKIDGEVKLANILEKKNFEKADIAFLFKLMDCLDFKGHKNAEELIRKLDVKWIVVSFSTLTLGRRKMRHPKRGWFEKMLERLRLSYVKSYEENEVFYVIRNTQIL